MNNKVLEEMKNADKILNDAKEVFQSTFFFDIEPPHQIFARAFKIDDMKMAEYLVDLMRDKQTKLISDENYKVYVEQMNNDGIIDLYCDCYKQEDNFPINCIEHLIKLFLKRNGVITFDPIAQKSYITNVLKLANVKPDNEMNNKSFRELLDNPHLRKFIPIFK